MITLKTILVPTDFSETSKVALTYARELASTYHGSVHVLHVLPDASVQPWAFGVETEAMGLSLPERQKRWEQRANEQMKNLFSETERKELNVRLVTQVGHPIQQILQYAKDQAVDLIVMGTLGRGTPEPTSGRAFPWNAPMGSVAERVVRQAPCPVLTIRHPEHVLRSADRPVLVVRSAESSFVEWLENNRLEGFEEGIAGINPKAWERSASLFRTTLLRMTQLTKRIN